MISFSLKHTVLNFSYQATKNLLLLQTFPIPTFSNAIGEAIFTHS